MRQVHENARISIMKTALDTDLNPTIPASLPPADLLRIIAEKDRVIAEHKALLEEREARLKEREALLAEQQKLLRLLEEQLRLARLRKFGSSSEKQPFQGELFDEAELEVSLEEVEQELAEAKAAAGAEPKKPRKRRKADGFQASLRSRERFWDIRVPKIDSIFDNSLVPRPSWSPGVPPQHRKLVAATHRSPI